MRIQLAKPLFAWDCLEDSPSLKTVRQFLLSIPDGPLLDGLSNQRGRGRNDYPVHVLFGESSCSRPCCDTPRPTPAWPSCVATEVSDG